MSRLPMKLRTRIRDMGTVPFIMVEHGVLKEYSLCAIPDCEADLTLYRNLPAHFCNGDARHRELYERMLNPSDKKVEHLRSILPRRR